VCGSPANFRERLLFGVEPPFPTAVDRSLETQLFLRRNFLLAGGLGPDADIGGLEAT
jgi:hypothetical protein